MFYAQFVLAKKGPLSKIWLAAHWEKKLTKAQIFETDVERAVEEVIKPKVKMALRTVGHLLLGIVRIYSKKTRYLLADTNEAFIKMRLNFRNGIQLELDNFEVRDDLNCEEMDACDEINMTIPEFMDFELDERLLQANLSRLEDITMKDDHDLNVQFEKLKAAENFKNFAKEFEDFGDFDVYGSYHTSSAPTPVPDPFEQIRRVNDLSNVDELPGNNTVIDQSSGMPLNITNQPIDKSILVAEDQINEPIIGDDLFSSMIDVAPQAAPGEEFEHMEIDNVDDIENNLQEGDKDDRGSFALDPLNLSHMEGKRNKKNRRIRKLIVDDITNIDNEALKEQLEDFSDIMATLNVAPPSKTMMKMRVTGDMQYLTEIPGMNMYNTELLNYYKSNLVPCSYKPTTQFDEDESTSSSRQSQPWEDLELNDNIADDICVDFGNDERPDSRLNDFDDIAPIGDIIQNGTLEVSMQDFNGILPSNFDDVGGFGFVNNKENQEDYVDPFSVSSNSSRGKLEAYGFGSAAKQAIYNDSKWVKRTNQILKKISNELENSEKVEFSTIVSSVKNRKQAAEQFYSLLSLAKSQAITVDQAEPFGKIVISTGDAFISALESANKTVIESPRPQTRTPLRAI